jgi:hypothetical protein
MAIRWISIQVWMVIGDRDSSFGSGCLFVIPLSCTSNHGNLKTLIKIVRIQLALVETLFLSRMVCAFEGQICAIGEASGIFSPSSSVQCRPALRKSH